MSEYLDIHMKCSFIYQKHKLDTTMKKKKRNDKGIMMDYGGYKPNNTTPTLYLIIEGYVPF